MNNDERRSAYYERLDKWIFDNPEEWVILNNWRKYRALINQRKQKCLAKKI